MDRREVNNPSQCTGTAASPELSFFKSKEGHAPDDWLHRYRSNRTMKAVQNEGGNSLHIAKKSFVKSDHDTGVDEAIQTAFLRPPLFINFYKNSTGNS